MRVHEFEEVRFGEASMALAPTAAGVVALLKQARPELTRAECKRLLKDTARPIRSPDAYGGAGSGIIDAFRAFRCV